MIKVVVLFALALSVPTIAVAQQPMGLLFPTLNSDSTGLDFPFYDAPSGNVVGFVRVDTSAYDMGYLSPLFYSIEQNDTLALETAYWDLRSRRYEERFLAFYGRSGDFVNILARTQPGGYWMRVDGLEVTPLIDQIIQYSGYLVHGYNAYRLRDTPSIEGRILIKLDEKRHGVQRFTGKTSNGWAEAVVVEIDRSNGEVLEDCYNLSDFEVVETWTGWIKVVDDAGRKVDIDHSISC